MAAFDFPNNPAVGDRTTNVGGIVYIWDGQKWVNGTTPSSNVQTNCVVFTGPAGPMYGCLDANGNIQVSDKNKVGKVWITQQGSIGAGTATPTSIIHAVAQDPALTLLSNSQNLDGTYCNIIIAAVSNATTNPDFVTYADSALITTKQDTDLNIAPSGVINLIPGVGGVYAVPITTGTGGYAFAVDLPTYNVGIGKTYPIYRLDVSTADLGPTLSTATQVHISSKNTDSGGYLTSVSDSSFYVTGGLAYNGTNWVAKSTSISMLVCGSSGTIAFNNDTGLTVGANYTPTERMRITTTGNIGIGTASPLYRLDVRTPGSTVSQVHIASTNTDAGGYISSTNDTSLHMSGGTSFNGTYWITKATAAGMVQIQGNGNILFSCDTGLTVGSVYNPTARMIIATGGNVGIGTANPGPTTALHVHMGTNQNIVFASASGTTASIQSTNDAVSTYAPINYLASSHYFGSGNVGIGASPAYRLQLDIDSAGKPGTNTWTIVSDIRTKSDVTRFDGDIEVIRKLNPTVANYNGKAQTPKGTRVVSFDPDELKAIVPQCVSYVKGKLDTRDKAETDIAGINIHEIFFHLLRTVQQIDMRLQKVETK